MVGVSRNKVAGRGQGARFFPGRSISIPACGLISNIQFKLSLIVRTWPIRPEVTKSQLKYLAYYEYN